VRGVRAKAAARVDLAGGSLDLWPIGAIIPNASTVNLALSLFARVECTRDEGGPLRLESEPLAVSYRWRPGDPPGALPLVERLCEAFSLASGWRIRTSSDVPPGSGLGGSSALCVALALAFQEITGCRRSHGEIVALCRDLEASNLRIPTGVQDFWPALRGGLLSIRYVPGGDVVEEIPARLEEVGRRLVVAYTGRSRLSAGTNWLLLRRFVDGDEDAGRRLRGIASVASRMREALGRGDLARCGPLLDEEMDLRRGLAEGLETPEMADLIERARGAGAEGAKACGAGGGGCLAFWVSPEARLEVERALRAAGAQVLNARPEALGNAVEVEP
jgi:D-glycero-alpha-D-manno-heptose-7-phosphate kinase